MNDVDALIVGGTLGEDYGVGGKFYEKKSQKSLPAPQTALSLDDSPEQQQQYIELLHDPYV